MNQITADILIVDDIPANLQFLAAMFKMRGYTTRAALSGKLAIQAVKNKIPDLILLDVRMPDIDGFEVCKRIKADPVFSDIPVIFVSGGDETLDKVKAFSSGGVDYITRPFQIDEVFSRISTHLDLRRQREQLRNTLQRMQELEALRDDLIHTIIHDLRNPLCAIENYLELIKTDEADSLSPKVSSYLTEAQAHTGNMIEMINSILDVNRMENRTLPLNLAMCDLVDLSGQVIRSMEPLRDSRALTLVAPLLPIQAIVDSGLVRRMLANLITNTIRSTRDVSGHIHISLHQIHDRVRINIEDNGAPIPAEEHLNVFEKYTQANSALSGSGPYIPGLGLPFCKLVAEAHGGCIGIENTPNPGNMFWVELPISGPPPR